MDFIFIGLTLGLFLLTAGLVMLCDTLKGS
jgi:hypothetical protein